MEKEKENSNQIIICQAEDGETRVDVRLEDETVWLTLNQLAELFQKAKSTVSEHIKNIYLEEELSKEPTVRKFRTVQIEKNVRLHVIWSIII